MGSAFCLQSNLSFFSPWAVHFLNYLVHRSSLVLYSPLLFLACMFFLVCILFSPTGFH
uniref:Uncharacterized protein n=1 Tax=Triticum urartu TaxID=4572 RepID=A0A8R7Q8P1_TRIUA